MRDRKINLTPQQRFLLEWLGQEDSSMLGECKGDDLDQLFRMGLAIVTPPRIGLDDGFRRVSLTDAGRDALASLTPAKE